MSHQPKPIYEFGHYRLDAAERLLWQDGAVVPLQPKVFDLLLVLVERHGRLLEKDELMKAVWPDTIVEEVNLANNISILRKVFGDGGNGQQFIETAPKRGYRFVANVKNLEVVCPAPIAAELPGSQSLTEKAWLTPASGEMANRRAAAPIEAQTGRMKGRKRGAIMALAILVTTGVILAYFGLRTPRPLKVTRFDQITRDGLGKGGQAAGYLQSALVTDGSRLYFSEPVNGHRVITQVSSAGGETVEIPAPFRNSNVLDISPSRSELIVAVHAGDEFEASLWLIPILGGAPRRLGDLIGHGAAWAPDGKRIVY